MGLFDMFQQKKKIEPEALVDQYFKLLTAYRPSFTSFEGSLYEMELTRSAIHSFATHASKLKPEVRGAANSTIKQTLQYRPNPHQDTSKFIYQLATIFMVQNNAFIIPLLSGGKDIVGYYPVMPFGAELREHRGKMYLLFDTGSRRAAIEYEKVGIINQYLYRDALFGESNCPMNPTLELMNTQNQGIIEGIKSSATIRFMARLAHKLADKDLKEELDRFSKMNLSSENATGVMMFDQRYEEVKQVLSRPYVVDKSQMDSIKENVFSYFGTNEAILQNKFNSEQWNAYYEGKIEPFAIQLSLTMTNMTFSQREISFGNDIIFTANRLQYASNSEKLGIVTQLFDRGFLTHNQGLEIFNMAGVGEEGNRRYIRKEYAEYNSIDKIDKENPQEGEDEEA